jgi:hypothetical protein
MTNRAGKHHGALDSTGIPMGPNFNVYDKAPALILKTFTSLGASAFPMGAAGQSICIKTCAFDCSGVTGRIETGTMDDLTAASLGGRRLLKRKVSLGTMDVYKKAFGYGE